MLTQSDYAQLLQWVGEAKMKTVIVCAKCDKKWTHTANPAICSKCHQSSYGIARKEEINA